jgi:hypothetical protein
MATHRRPLARIQVHRLDEDPDRNRQLADVVQRGRDPNVLQSLPRDPQPAGDRTGENADVG